MPVFNPRRISLSNGTLVSVNPADASTYHFALPGLLLTVEGYNRIYMPACHVTEVHLHVLVLTTPASTETSTLSLRVNQTTDHTVSTAITHDTGGAGVVFSTTGLSIPLLSGQYFAWKIAHPTWATDPVGVLYNWSMIYEI